MQPVDIRRFDKVVVEASGLRLQMVLILSPARECDEHDVVPAGA